MRATLPSTIASRASASTRAVTSCPSRSAVGQPRPIERPDTGISGPSITVSSAVCGFHFWSARSKARSCAQASSTVPTSWPDMLKRFTLRGKSRISRWYFGIGGTSLGAQRAPGPLGLVLPGGVLPLLRDRREAEPHHAHRLGVGVDQHVAAPHAGGHGAERPRARKEVKAPVSGAA